MERARVAEVRRFNRTVTAEVGALSDRFLGRDRALGEARLLWEIGPRRLRAACAAGAAGTRLRLPQPPGPIARGRRPRDGRLRRRGPPDARRAADAGRG